MKPVTQQLFFFYILKEERTACLNFSNTPISLLLLHLSSFPLLFIRACSYKLALMCDIVLDVNLSSSTAKSCLDPQTLALVLKEVLFGVPGSSLLSKRLEEQDDREDQKAFLLRGGVKVIDKL